jgi:hypothetical protein
MLEQAILARQRMFGASSEQMSGKRLAVAP